MNREEKWNSLTDEEKQAWEKRTLAIFERMPVVAIEAHIAKLEKIFGETEKE